MMVSWRANVDVLTDPNGEIYWVPLGRGEVAARCYRCGVLLTRSTVTVDRRVPGIEGGTYEDSNIRPACALCNSETGGALGAARKAAKWQS